ncbi:MAG: hypothetical protein QME79_12010 [Bacillota bacterium]|nr:hypothetical protein [Bacillota bacterium]
MTRPNDSYGKPFDILLLAGPQSESGLGLRDIADVSPVVAEALLLLSSYPLRDTAAALTNNVLSQLDALTVDGEPTAWGGVGTVVWKFPAVEIADYFAGYAAGALISGWLEGAGEERAGECLRTVAHASGITDLDALMGAIQFDQDNRPRIGSFAREARKSLRGRRIKRRDRPALLRDFETAFTDRLRQAVAEALADARALCGGFAGAVEGEACRILDTGGVPAGGAFARGGRQFIANQMATLEGHRGEIGAELTAAQTVADSAFRAFEAAATGPWFALLRRRKARVDMWLAAADNAFRLRFAYELTGAALAALAETEQTLNSIVTDVETLEAALVSARDRLREGVASFETRPATPVSQVTERPLYTLEDLARLHRDRFGVDLGSLTDAMRGEVQERLGGPSSLLRCPSQTVVAELLQACWPVMKSIAGMTADDFARWLSEEGRMQPSILLKGSETLAPVLCRYDRARFSDAEDLRDSTFVLVGVPDAQTSPLAGVGPGLLVSTGDPERIIYLVLKLGFAASHLWHFPEYRQAYEGVRRQGRVAQEIYPDYPYNLLPRLGEAFAAPGRGTRTSRSRRKHGKGKRS